MKPFNLQEAIAGKPIQTRDGRVLKFVAHVPEAGEMYKVVIMLGGGYIGCWREDGKYLKDEEGDGDIVMVPVIKTYYVNVFRSNYSYAVFASQPLDNKTEVEGHKEEYSNNSTFIETLSFDIEE
jgi:hypothetical protein